MGSWTRSMWSWRSGHGISSTATRPLTRIFASPSTLSALKPHLAWLRQEVLAGVARGVERASIHHANLIPPGLLGGAPDAHLPYFVMREHVIDRIYDQRVGYWQADLQGLDHLGRADRGTLLVEYLGVSERQLVEAAERMIADGKHELAATALDWTRERFGASRSFREVERLAYRKLAEKFQEFDPFKFILYSARSGDGTAQMGAEGRASLATTQPRQAPTTSTCSAVTTPDERGRESPTCHPPPRKLAPTEGLRARQGSG